MLLLGSTGKVIRPTNNNSGVAAVALVTLNKLVIPLKVLNMDDKEYGLMKEIILFNPGNIYTVVYNYNVLNIYLQNQTVYVIEKLLENIANKNILN